MYRFKTKLIAFSVALLLICTSFGCALAEQQTSTTAASVIIGDANGDGEITMLDVTDTQKSIAKLVEFTPEQTKRADVDGNGELNMLDVTTVQKYIAKLISAFPAEKIQKDSESDTNSETAPTDTSTETEKDIASEAETEIDTEIKQNVLVIVFSATGTTKGVAQRIAALTGGDLKDIIPAQPYTSEDLNYGDSTTRATAEQNDPAARPEIAENISLDGYGTVYLGYPIWWGQAPRIMSTFVESHDFTGITVIPFCTSGSSDIGQSDDTLAEQANSGNWIQGKRFSGGISDEELQEWIDEINGENMKKALHLYINDTQVPVSWEDNKSVEALTELVKSAPLTISMSMYGGFEQVGSIGTDLPASDKQTTTDYGDIVLYSGNQIVIFYGSNSWSYTRLGHIDFSKQEMTDILANGNVNVTLKYE